MTSESAGNGRYFGHVGELSVKGGKGKETHTGEMDRHPDRLLSSKGIISGRF